MSLSVSHRLLRRARIELTRSSQYPLSRLCCRMTVPVQAHSTMFLYENSTEDCVRGRRYSLYPSPRSSEITTAGQGSIYNASVTHSSGDENVAPVVEDVSSVYRALLIIG